MATDVNGIAVGVLELKRSTISVGEGIRQNLGNQKKGVIGPFFSTVQLVMAGNDTEGLRYGTIETAEKYYLRWREEGEEPNLLDRHLMQLCSKTRLLEMVHDFVVFDEMQIGTGVRDVSVVFDRPGALEKEVATTPKDAVDNYRIDALNLPSHNWITKDVRGEIGADLRNRLGDSYDVRVRGFLPTGVRIEHVVCLNGEDNNDDSHHKQSRGPWYRRIFR